jgi:hypothetical protein
MRFNRTHGISMGRDAGACPAPLCDVRRNHHGGQRVKTIRWDTGALRRPLHENEFRSGASSQEVARQLAVASRAITEAGSSRDGRRNSARPSLGN